MMTRNLIRSIIVISLMIASAVHAQTNNQTTGIWGPSSYGITNTITLSPNGSSVNGIIPAGPSVYACNIGAITEYIAFGTNSGAAASLASGFPAQPGNCYLFNVSGYSYIAAIATSSASITVSSGSSATGGWRPLSANGSTQTISVSNSSANIAFPLAATAAYVCNTGAAIAFVNFSTTATTSSQPVLANNCALLKTPQAVNLAAITASGSTTVTVSIGDGDPGASGGSGVGPTPSNCGGIPCMADTGVNAVVPAVDVSFLLQVAAKCDGVTNDAAIINAAMLAASTAGNGRLAKVVLPFGTCMIGAPIILYSNVVLAGQGEYLTTLKASANSCADVVQGLNAYSLFGTNATGILGWQIADLSIDGNKANQSGCGNNDAVNGISQYGASFVLQNVHIANTLGHGIRSEWQQNGETSGLEAAIYNVTVDTTGRHGVWWNGPHDSRTDRLVVVDASQETDNTYKGLYVDSKGQGVWSYFHGWHRAAATNRVSYQLSSPGSVICSFCEFEGGRSQVEHRGNYDIINAGQIYGHFGSTNSAMEVFEGNANRTDATFTGTPNSTIYAQQYGVTAGATATLNVTNGMFISFDNVGAPFNFANTLGNNIITGRGSTTAGGAVACGLTPNFTDTVTYLQTQTGQWVECGTPGYGPGTAVALHSQHSNWGAGNQITLTGFGSMGLGYRVADRGAEGKNCFASGGFGVNGAGQTCDHTLWQTTSAASAIRLTADGGVASGNTASGFANCIPLPDNSAFSTDHLLTIRDGTTGDFAIYTLRGAGIKRGSGAASVAIAATTFPSWTIASASSATAAGWNAPSMTADATNGCINISWTPPGANTDAFSVLDKLTTAELAH